MPEYEPLTDQSLVTQKLIKLEERRKTATDRDLFEVIADVAVSLNPPQAENPQAILYMPRRNLRIKVGFNPPSIPGENVETSWIAVYDKKLNLEESDWFSHFIAKGVVQGWTSKPVANPVLSYTDQFTRETLTIQLLKSYLNTSRQPS